MGNCNSCLGNNQARSVYDEDDESRMLFEDADDTNYGSFGDAMMNDRDEAHESQREADALQNVVTRTSDNMVDVFEIAPPLYGLNGLPAPYSLSMPGIQFQHLLSKLSDTDDADLAEDDDCDYDAYEDGEANGTGNTMIDVDVVTADDRDPATQSQYHKLLSANAEAAGVLVGNFTDAATEA